MEFSYRFYDKELGLKPRMGLNMNSRRWQPTEYKMHPNTTPMWVEHYLHFANHLFNPIRGCAILAYILPRRLSPTAIYV